MNVRDVELAIDLATAAASSAMESLVLKANLGFDPAMKTLVVAVAISIIEAKSRTLRAKLPPELASILNECFVANLATAEAANFDSICAKVASHG